MSFTETLSELAFEIRQCAVRRMFEEEGYAVGRENADVLAIVRLNVDAYLALSETGIDLEYGSRERYYVEECTDVWNLKWDELKWIETHIMQFGQSNPSALRELLTSVRKVPERLRVASEWAYEDNPLEWFNDRGPDVLDNNDFRVDILLENGIEEFKNWTGNTAKVYELTFGSSGQHWGEIVSGNYCLAEVLTAALEAQLAVFLAARESIVDICDKTLEALSHVNESDGGGDASAILSIVGAIAGATLNVMSFGTAAAVVGAGFAITSTMVDQAEDHGRINSGARNEKAEIGGDTVMGVLASMDSAITNLTTKIGNKEDAIRNTLRNAYNDVLGGGGIKPRYRLTFDSGTPELSQQTLGDRKTDASPLALREAARDAFPPAAERLLRAHGTLAESGGEVGEFTGEYYTGPTIVQDAWVDLRNLLQDLTGHNGEKVKHAGQVLLQYATETGEVDKDNAENIERTYDGLDVEYSGEEHKPWEEPSVPPQL